MSIKILVVDDNRDNLRSYVKELERHVKAKQWNSNSFYGSDSALSPSVESADTVSKALEKLRDNNYSILVIDLKIPSSSGEEMGGFELISASKMLDPLRPIIAVTAYGTVSLARTTLTQGLFDFIEKSSPTAVEELIDAVQRAVDDRHEKIRRVGNPFTSMTGIEPTIFGGRDKELKFFEEKLDRVIVRIQVENNSEQERW
jgi:DNA-binding NtrC family response regulator